LGLEKATISGIGAKHFQPSPLEIRQNFDLFGYNFSKIKEKKWLYSKKESGIPCDWIEKHWDNPHSQRWHKDFFD